MAEPPPTHEGEEGCDHDGSRAGGSAGAGSRGSDADDALAGNGSPRNIPHEALLEWAAAIAADSASLIASYDPIPEELESIICEVARSGATSGYPWDALRFLLARKVEAVLRDFVKESKDLDMEEGELFDRQIIEPLMHSLLEPRRTGAPFTAQRLCELLTQPRPTYTSAKRYLFALQRVILVTATEELLASDKWEINVTASLASATRKRKLPPELANGVV